MIKVSQVKSNTYNEFNFSIGICRHTDSGYYTSIKKALSYTGLNYNTHKHKKLPFTYKEYHFEKVEVK